MSLRTPTLDPIDAWEDRYAMPKIDCRNMGDRGLASAKENAVAMVQAWCCDGGGETELIVVRRIGSGEEWE